MGYLLSSYHMLIKVSSRQNFPENASLRIQEGKEIKILANSSQYHEYVTVSGANPPSSGRTDGMKTRQSEIVMSTA
jgi:hypothetical protein